MTMRPIEAIYKGRETRDGAGVRLKRIFAHSEVREFDPFLLLDDFGARDPKDYMPGFPWHPHRGMETVTYMLHGVVRHGDSMGNSGEIRDGQIQWMTAGRGVVHQEMPQRQEDCLRGFQLWVNLPAAQKMMEPRYRDIKVADIPEITSGNGVVVKIVAGRYEGRVGPVRDIVCDPEYLDIRVPAGVVFKHPIKKGHTAFAYAFEGDATSAGDRRLIPEGTPGPVRRREWDRPGGGRRRRPVPARLGQAHRRARGLGRPHRHEHPGRARARVPGIPGGDLHPSR